MSKDGSATLFVIRSKEIPGPWRGGAAEAAARFPRPRPPKEKTHGVTPPAR